MTKNSDVKKAFVATIPVMTGYLVLGMGFGIVLSTKGLGFIWAIAMSIFIYAGSMQYAAIGLITGGASILTTALTTLMVNARHLFYGISMIDKYKDTGKAKPYLIYALTDETYSLVCSDESVNNIENKNLYYFLVSFFDQIYWVAGSAIGGLLGEVIPFSTEGIDFALTALFVTIFVEQWLSVSDHKPAITGLSAAVVCLLIFGPDNFLIPTMILITAALLLRRKGNING